MGNKSCNLASLSFPQSLCKSLKSLRLLFSIMCKVLSIKPFGKLEGQLSLLASSLVPWSVLSPCHVLVRTHLKYKSLLESMLLGRQNKVTRPGP